MSARDDYPIERTTPYAFYTIDPGRWKDMCDEIDRLRSANEFMREVLDDVLPTLHVQGATYFKADGHWVRITIEPASLAEPPQAKATIVT